MALENNREVMAVPGKIDSPLSRGTHKLIKEGAKLVESVEDIMAALGYIGRQLEEHVTTAAKKASEKIEAPLFEIKELKLAGHEKTVFESLRKEPLHIEQIIAASNLAAGSVNASLVSLRLKGLIKQLPGSMFARR
jgi:DNA processing protein